MEENEKQQMRILVAMDIEVEEEPSFDQLQCFLRLLRDFEASSSRFERMRILEACVS